MQFFASLLPLLKGCAYKLMLVPQGNLVSNGSTTDMQVAGLLKKGKEEAVKSRETKCKLSALSVAAPEN